MNRSTGSGFACRLKMEQPNVAEDVMVETTADADKGFKGLETIWISIKHFEHNILYTGGPPLVRFLLVRISK